ncbi:MULTISPECIES: GntR family transcriptional regulator [unclassified Leifsonia]|uniref:GntR family transcriptional regulator n=1 Tax=unclassified Leifsonia TaxID=2663824 RepID=UPI0008A7A8C3|nr:MULTISPECIES: GntR family transcriptional regulator [unclassified Leifsonia]SEI14160.1 DNA-binding transcriptional regulator, GntR family [Leifsonia sp. CL154]SFM01082.1 DNA-binding transcriptional regulator, GntR family [Leifsonia sp. CL147]
MDSPITRLTQSASRTGLVVQALRLAILSGELPAGQPLVEADLAERFGISKTPVREALKTLSGAGLVTMSEYRGATVRVVDPQMAYNVFDMRALLEPTAVARTVENGADVEAARSALRRADAAETEAERSLANRDFHRELYAGCGNDILVSTLDGLREQTALITVNAWTRRPSWEEEAEEHQQILEAVAAGDPSAASTRVLEHIRSFETLAIRQLQGVK